MLAEGTVSRSVSTTGARRGRTDLFDFEPASVKARQRLDVHAQALAPRAGQRQIPQGRQIPCGVEGSGTLTVDLADAVPEAANANERAKSVVKAIFLSIGPPCGLVFLGFGESRQELARLPELQEQLGDQLGKAVSSAVCAGEGVSSRAGDISVYASEVTLYCGADPR